MARRAFRIGSWATLVLGALGALAAVTVVVCQPGDILEYLAEADGAFRKQNTPVQAPPSA